MALKEVRSTQKKNAKNKKIDPQILIPRYSEVPEAEVMAHFAAGFTPVVPGEKYVSHTYFRDVATGLIVFKLLYEPAP